LWNTRLFACWSPATLRRLWQKCAAFMREIPLHKCTLWHRRWYIMWQFWSWQAWFKNALRRVCRIRQWRTQEFLWGRGFNKFSWGQRTERTGV
jgi:hypothetical protein